MAEIVLSFMVEESLARIVSLIAGEIGLAWNLKNDLKDLQDSLTMIRVVLQDAGEQQIKREPVRLWLNNLKQVAYDAEDLFDKLTYENLRHKVENEFEVHNFNPITKLTHYAKKTNYHVKTACKVKNVNKSLSKIKKEAMTFGLQVSPTAKVNPRIDLDRVTDSILDSPVVGREADVVRIVNLLSCSCHQQPLTIIPIVGMGGLGKTFVAKLVCHEVMMRKLFDVKIWICVSNNSNDQNILGEILQCLCPSMAGLTNKDAIISQLQNELERKKLLLVLDDVWDDASNWWDGLRTRLLRVVKNNGSAIILTTRKEDVASIMESSHQHRHNLDCLSDGECWSIIRNEVLGNGGKTITSDLESIGQEIAKKCKGVPLAAKVFGGTLSGLELEKTAWLSISNNKVLNALDEKDIVETILKLSFDHLPSYLKPCFVYCSVFPKDFLIEKEELIQLWMAEGFLTPQIGDVGDNYFNALVSNSFFQDVEKDAYENIIACKMHDLVHDLAISLSKSEVLTLKNNSLEANLSCIRHVNLSGQYAINVMAVCQRKLRTIFLLNEVHFDESWKLKNLRTLKLKGSTIQELPSQIGEWKSLRYLDVSKTKVVALPTSITKLYNLQTLRFLECWYLRELPRGKFNHLVNLKHIEFSEDDHMPSGLGRLTSLERLPLFVVSSDRGGSIQELEYLNELRGKLTIKHLEEVRDKEEAEKANLQAKEKVTALQFEWSSDRCCSNAEQVLDGLRPHCNIERIKIEYYQNKKFPSWLVMMKVPSDGGSFTFLNKLVELELHNCFNCERVPSLGNLPSLRYLYINFMARVRSIGNEFYGIGSCDDIRDGWRLFPALKQFLLSDLYSLVEWMAPEVDDRVCDVFPSLEELRICGCNGLTKIPMNHLSLLVKLDIEDCGMLEYIFGELQSFPCLKSLSIKRSNLTCMPSALQSFISLEELNISCCQSLTSIPKDLGILNSLVSLEIYDCGKLKEFPSEILGSLTRLKTLRLGGFSKLEDFSYLNSIQHLSSLQELTIQMSTAASLPEQLQHLAALKYLSINHFYDLEALPEWLGNLSSLQTLDLFDCGNLKYLPSGATMKHLSKLTRLRLIDCPCLSRSCDKGSGPEWYKISHIPNIAFS